MPEIVRKDHFGNGNQPNTFDPIKLNSHHLGQLSRVGASRKRGWWYKIFARRVHKKRTMRLSGLIDPIPPIAKDIRSAGPQRTKWNGLHRMGVLSTVAFVTMGVASLLGGVALLVYGRKMHRLDAAIGALVSCLAFSELGKIADQERPPPTFRAMTLCLCMIVAQFGLIHSRPIERLNVEISEKRVDGIAFSFIFLLMGIGAYSSPASQGQRPKAVKLS